MLNKLAAFIRRYELLQPGDTVICAVSGGADSMALLWGMYLLRDKLQISLAAAHFNHGLRGTESDAEQAYVVDFCRGYDIPVYIQGTVVRPGKKGLEAAAREARYAFFQSLPGKIATAHTADDNAETVLLHLVRGTGLKGLGAIAPVNGKVIRPMLQITKAEVLAFLEEYHIGYMTDSSNETDAFLRNRIRHHVMPLLKQENPQLAENMSELALRLRQDEELLRQMPQFSVSQLRELHPAQRARALCACLESWGVKEPEASHIALAEKLVFSDKPSARASFPGGITVCRNYDRLERWSDVQPLERQVLPCPGELLLPQLGVKVSCTMSQSIINEKDRFTVCPWGELVVRSRCSTDKICLQGGTKSLKKLFIDRKIPAAQRMQIPVIADDNGVLGVYGIGADQKRIGSGVCIRFEALDPNQEL